LQVAPFWDVRGKKLLLFLSRLLSWMTGAIRFITVPIMHRSAQALWYHEGKADVAEKSNHKMSKKMFILLVGGHPGVAGQCWELLH